MNTRASLFTFLTILIALIILFFRMIEPFVISVLMGAILALLLNPFFNKLRRLGWPPNVSAALVSVFLSLLIVVPIVAFSSVAVKEAMVIGQALTKNENLSYRSVSEKIASFPLAETLGGNEASIEQSIRSGVQNVGETISAGVIRFVKHLPELILHMILALFACFIFLLNGKAFTHWLFEKIPIDRDVEEKIKTSAEKTSTSVILSVLAASATQMVIIFFGFLFLGVPGAFFAAGATFLLSFVPIISCVPVWLSGAFYLYLHGEHAKCFIMIGVGILNALAENIVRPLVLQGRNNMHPLLSLIAIFGGLHMFGLFGVLMGPIITALMVSLLQIWPIVGKRSGIKFGENL